MKATLKLKLLAYTPNPDAVVAKGGKLCYYPGGIEELEEGLTEEKIGRFVTMLAEMEHESPLEHAVFTFGIEGVSRSLTHQLVRHRLASYSQKSQRYVSEGSFEYVIPKDISNNEEAQKTFIKAMENAQEAYDKITEELLAEKIKGFYKEKKQTIEVGNQEIIQHCKKHFKRDYSALEKLAIENARAVLPNACETKIIVTMNARILLHFFKKRCCSRAQEEIRDLATEMLKLVKTVAPNIFRYAGPACVHDVCPEGDMTCGRAKEIREQFNRI
ncbi:thymidylate synthase ThyX [Clostridium aceticum]|uniref:Flavin-dependent thymidylate synthase n=1 Tax=Clostridium aceticum TaxID=84022 RepID=A0A0D8I7J6_9CLOT|nr:FAD-dependent thymidylate synthase [Clostridium aceticum]AKL97073.1 thymidylate synthase ThyX [Clostridium aceticum]KJF26029.1 FAD-dependent thymidylate synthase [Clostridium aceticum]